MLIPCTSSQFVAIKNIGTLTSKPPVSEHCLDHKTMSIVTQWVEPDTGTLIAEDQVLVRPGNVQLLYRAEDSRLARIRGAALAS